MTPRSESAHALLVAGIDYAGLFPPASLDMQAAVDNYAAYRAGSDAWALGRFVVPATRLEEFTRAADAHLAAVPSDAPWLLSSLGGADLMQDVEDVARLNRELRGVLVDAIEFKAATPAAVRQARALIPAEISAYAELPLGTAVPALVDAARACGSRAKVRTGGVTADAFPEPAALAEFIAVCGTAGVPFKATAGLHHATRGEYRLTYERGSARASMFGFLNVFLAAAFAGVGALPRELATVLGAGTAADFAFDDAGVSWRDRHVTTAELRRARARGVVAFGSCSFSEPLAELAALSII